MKQIKKLALSLSITALIAACGDGGSTVVATTSVVQVSSSGTYQTNSNNSYIAKTSNGLINFLLPPTPTTGDQVVIIGGGGTDWTVQPNSGQRIRLEGFGGDVVTGPLVFAPSSGLSTSAGYSSIATSSDGHFLIASSTHGIYKSNDYGETWNLSSAPKKTYTSVASSLDGRYLAAVASGNAIYISSDFGETWSASGAPTDSYGDITINNDGSRLTAASYSNGIYISIDGGATWILSTLPSTAYTITASSDGTKLFAGTQSGVYSSIDYGVTWTVSLNSNLSFYSVTSSEDGNRLVAQADDSQGYPTAFLSTDNAATWKQLTLPIDKDYSPLRISGDGNHLILSTSLNGIYISNDDGITWLQSGSSNDLRWYGFAVNRDATHISIIVGDPLGYPMYSPYYWWTGRIFSLLTNNHNGIKAGPTDALTLQYLGNDVWGVLNKVGQDFKNY